jgi:hypothetical protein
MLGKIVEEQNRDWDQVLHEEDRIMVFNTTFNNISEISWRSVLLEEESRGFFLSHKSYVYKNKGDYYKNLKTAIFIKLLLIYF